MKKLLLTFILCLFWANAFAATQLLKTVMPSGGDYTSLEACMNANEQNLVTADKYFDVKIDGTWSSADTTACIIHLYTTDATRYINIYTTSAARHLGVWSTSYYMLEISQINDSGIINIGVSNLNITGLQIRNSKTTNAVGHNTVSIASGTNIVFYSCIIRSPRYCFIYQGVETAYIINSFLYSYSTIVGNDALYVASGTVNCYSSTLISARYGIYNFGGTVTAKNCYAYGGTAAYQGTITQTTCASNDATATGTALDNILYSTANFTNVTSLSENLHLVSGSALIDVGTNTSGESAPLNFTDDIDGVTRTGTWDIGAEEYVTTTTGYGQVIIISE